MMGQEMITIAAVTAVLALLVGRFIGRVGLVIASIVVLAASAALLWEQYDGLSYVLLVILNVAIFQILAVCMMLFWPSGK
jgi:hypothetical protein